MNNYGESRNNSSTWWDHLLIKVPTVFRIQLWIKTLELSLWLKKPKTPVIIITVIYQWLSQNLHESRCFLKDVGPFVKDVSDLGEECGLVPDAEVNGQCGKSQSQKRKALEWVDECFSFLTHCTPTEERIWHVLEMPKKRYFHTLF